MIYNRTNSIPAINIMGQASKKKLGEILIEKQMITQQELSEVLAIQHNEGSRLGEILVKQGYISMEELMSILSSQFNVPVVDLKKIEVQPRALALVPEEIARKSNIIPLELDDDSLLLGMAFPDDVQTLRDIATRTGKRVQIVIASLTDINNAIDLYYRAGKEIQLNLEQLHTKKESREDSDIELTAETPVAQSLYLILRQAVRDRASDVHIEPQEDRVRIRFRIDGMLHDMYALPLTAFNALISRVKILAEMNIAEQRRSQDGQFSIQVGLKEIDIRAATMATSNGERVALRILDKTLSPLSLEEIGFLPEQLEIYRKMLGSSFGVILVGGPTGSGKTTTLYASLNQFDRNVQNIITIEDPIEYKFADINQTQINPKAGITFAGGLRTILRHDPDVVLVGEVRDKDTASIVTQAALTGRLVLATIHANDAISILFRLIDLGIEPYLISPTLIAAVSQRMVRRICPYCKTESPVSAVEAAAFRKETGVTPGHMFKGKGCNMCAETGFRGRVALIEMMAMGENIRRLVLAGASSDEIKNAALKEGMVTMQRDGMIKASQGITTINEVLRSTCSGFY
ncbi:MAG: type II/IV secretion system protein [Dehalococcoidales bacterium]|nr:type II/IV secretion system protein [Dehalococcoidales bacterium]